MTPDEFPAFRPVAHLDIEHTKRVDADQWKRDSLNAQAELAIMKAEHRRDKRMYFAAGFLIGLAVPAGLLGSLLTKFFE